MNPSTTYRRMPGSAGLIMRKRLWLGPDHILMVRSHVLSEEYRRFYFADIEALVVAEVEFPDRTACRKFKAPAWFGREVTGNKRYSNVRLATE